MGRDRTREGADEWVRGVKKEVERGAKKERGCRVVSDKRR